MQHNRQIIISQANSRKATNWNRQELYWSEFIDRLKVPARGTETLEEYIKLPKTKQDELKDVGGFVAGELKDGRRKANNVLSRDVVTLDLDNIETGKTTDILKRIEGLGCAYLVYSTRKHAQYKPRLRVLIPTDRRMTADEYEPVCRKVGSIIGIELCDPTTFEASRLMYYPSVCKNGEYVFEYGDKPFLQTDGVLGMYANWKDISEWPQVPGSDLVEKRLVAKQQDPTEKEGLVGAFCRSYNVIEAIEKFIPDMYETCDIENRYTFLGGSTTGGAIIYGDGNFIYSHHATDPISAKLCNAFDLIRIHKFGDLDNEAKEGTPVGKLPSFTEMNKFALADTKVSNLLNKEKYELAKEAFSGSNVLAFPPDKIENEDINWLNLITKNSNGAIEKTINNIVTILENNPDIKGKIVLDEFANRGLVLGALPWNPSTERREWSDVDDAGLAMYLERVFDITGREKINNALLMVSFNNRINDVKCYLEGLKWDGVKRVETLLVDYLGAEDNVYTRAVMRKSLAAGVARIMEKSVKWDCMPILAGAQGIGKSTFLSHLGKNWFSDSLQTFEGKEASEMIQGTWINEIGELTGMKKTEVNCIKQFLSKKEDIFRVAYGKRTEKFPRKCIFFGTSNDDEFLKDVTGNRRFLPVDCGINKPTKSIFTELEGEVDQIWAEAYMFWQLGEFLDLEGEAKELAKIEQEKHRESNPKEGIIRDFLEKKITSDWDSKSLQNRKLFWSENFSHSDVELVERKKVCALEIWCECFNSDPRNLKRTDSIEINNILGAIPGWQKVSSVRHYSYCGRQKGFEKID